MFFSQSKCFLNIFSLNKSWIWKYWWNSWFATSSESVHGQNYQRANERGINLSTCLEIIKNLQKSHFLSPLVLERRRMAGLRGEWAGVKGTLLRTQFTSPRHRTVVPAAPLKWNVLLVSWGVTHATLDSEVAHHRWLISAECTPVECAIPGNTGPYLERRKEQILTCSLKGSPQCSPLSNLW